MKIVIVLLAIISCCIMGASAETPPPIEPGVSQELARWRAAHYSDVRYKLNLTLEKMSPVLKGSMEIRLKYVTQLCTECPDRYIILDWRKIRGHEEKSTVSNVSLNDKQVTFSRLSPRGDNSVPAPYEEINEHLVFRDGVVAGENVIKLDFTSPILTSGSAITRYLDKEDGSEYIYSLFVPSDASTAFPVFDQPDLKARFSLDLKVDKEWKAISNSNIERTTKYECKVRQFCANGFEFAQTQPISTYVFAFAAGPFERVSSPTVKEGATPPVSNDALSLTVGLPTQSEPPAVAGGLTQKSGSEPAFRTVSYDVGHREASRQNTNAQPPTTVGGSDIYVRKSQAEKFKPHAAEAFRLNREAIKYFEQYFDYRFPFPKYDLVLIPEFPFGGMEHAGATFLRESAIIFPQEPTKNDYISRATLIFHETAHQWFGDTVTMRWFDDLWLKEGFATFMAYKAMEKIMPEMNSWKVFYERVKQGAYQTDSTKGTTPIYQEIKNLSAAKSAYGAIVYNKAPAFLRQAEFYLGEDKFQTAVRAFLKKHEFGNAEWTDLVKEFEAASGQDLKGWADAWVRARGLARIRYRLMQTGPNLGTVTPSQENILGDETRWLMKMQALIILRSGKRETLPVEFVKGGQFAPFSPDVADVSFVLPNYQDYGYGIFLLDDKSRDYVLKNIYYEKDPFLRSMMWGALWDSVREGELNPREYVELVAKNLTPTPPVKAGTPPKQGGELDESTTALLLNRVGTAMNHYIDSGRDAALAGGTPAAPVELRTRVENLLIERMEKAETLGQRITFYRAFLNTAASENARSVLKKMLTAETPRRREDMPLKTKDKFDIVTRLLILGDPDAPRLLAELEKTEKSDDAKRYAYAAKAGIATAENKAKFWNDFTNNKEISESWIEAAFVPWNSIRHSELTLPYLQKALQELPNHKRNRKIFFVNGWLGAFIGGQRSEEALAIVNKFLADNPDLDRDLRLKILENVDLIERAVRIRAKYGRN